MLGFGIFDYIKLGLGALAGALLAGAIIGPIEHYRGYSAGTADMRAAVEKQNAAAAESARVARTKLDQCYADGGSWSQTEGRCEK